MNETIREIIGRNYDDSISKLCVKPGSRDKYIAEQLSDKKVQERLVQIGEAIDLNLASARILDLGSGFGPFVTGCQSRGMECCGIEMESSRVQVSAMRMQDTGLTNTVVQGVGEYLPYKDRAFDIVVSFQVLEHTNSPEAVLSEATRVLKEGGYLYFVIPNYHSFWEGHYAVLWLPSLPKSLAKAYLRMRGRDHTYLDSINYITPRRLRNALSGGDLKVLGWGIQTWEDRLKGGEFSTWGETQRLRKWVKLAQRLKMSSAIAYLGKKLDFFYPIILTARKLSAEEALPLHEE